MGLILIGLFVVAVIFIIVGTRGSIQTALWMSWKEQELESLPCETFGCFFSNPEDGGNEPVVKGKKIWRWTWDNG